MTPLSRAAATAAAAAAIASLAFADVVTEAWPAFVTAFWSIFWRTALVVIAVDLLVLGVFELALRAAHKKEHKQT